MGDATMQAPAVAKPQGEALRWASVGLTVAALDIGSLVVSGLLMAGMVVDAAVYTLTPPG